MNADLERLITLQRLDSTAEAARRRLADEPEREKTLEARLESARQRVAHAKEHLTANQTARREIDKEVAVHQGRLSKYREQAMAVKTNVEYHAIQKEIGHAQAEIKTHEDRMLERMLEADDLTAAVKKAEADLAAEQKAVDADRKAMKAERFCFQLQTSYFILPFGPIAQRLEPPAHNRLVPGSNPGGPSFLNSLPHEC